MSEAAEENLLDKFRKDQGTQLVLLGLLVGVLSGVAAVLYRWLIAAVQMGFFGTGDSVLDAVRSAPVWRRMLMPAVGGLLVGIVSKVMLGKEGASHGVPDVMEAIQAGKPLPRRIILVRALTSALTIGSGGSTGREGPIAHIGSTIGSALGRLLKKRGELLKTMIACGAAGGIAATFNAPITGALFALEIFHGDVAVRHFTPIVISSVIATVVSHSMLGHLASDFPALTNGQMAFSLKSGWELPIYMVAAILAGFICILFMQLLELSEEAFHKLKIPGWLKPALGGLLLACITIFLPQLHGFSNYTTINAVFEARYVWYLIAIMGVFKMVTTSLTLGSGGTGGVFAPCLFVGAMLGNTFGYVVHKVFPQITAEPGSYALVGMGAIMAGVTGAPLTSVVLIFELSGKYTIILPLLITCAVSTILVQIVMKGSVFTRPLQKKGIVYGERRNVLRASKVRDIVRTDFLTTTPQTKLKELLELLSHSKQYAFPVLDEKKDLVGIISIQDFQGAVLDRDLDHVLVVGELMSAQVITTVPEESLEDALLKIGDENIEYLPVLESKDSKRVVGLISRRDILSCYSRDVRERIELSRAE